MKEVDISWGLREVRGTWQLELRDTWQLELRDTWQLELREECELLLSSAGIMSGVSGVSSAGTNVTT